MAVLMHLELAKKTKDAGSDALDRHKKELEGDLSSVNLRIMQTQVKLNEYQKIMDKLMYEANMIREELTSIKRAGGI
jgi:peptidoglycan hydrolase CwlO-like protein